MPEPAAQQRFAIVDRDGSPWKIGVIWPFGAACNRLARAERFCPGRGWQIVLADANTPRRQLGFVH